MSILRGVLVRLIRLQSDKANNLVDVIFDYIFGNYIYQVPVSIKVLFLPDNVVTEAEPGEPMLQVAERAGVFIPTGCLMGSCHACEVELGDGTPVCACISSISGEHPELTITLYDDPLW